MSEKLREIYIEYLEFRDSAEFIFGYPAIEELFKDKDFDRQEMLDRFYFIQGRNPASHANLEEEDVDPEKFLTELNTIIGILAQYIAKTLPSTFFDRMSEVEKSDDEDY